MNEFPQDNVMWMEAFRAKYDGLGEFGRKEWDQLLGNYSVSPDHFRSHRLPQIDRYENSLSVIYLQ